MYIVNIIIANIVNSSNCGLVMATAKLIIIFFFLMFWCLLQYCSVFYRRNKPLKAAYV